MTVNGIVVGTEGFPSPEAAVAYELLRQRVLALGLIAEEATRETVDTAIERLLEREVEWPAPSEEECRRYYEGHPDEFTSGEIAIVRHILFQVTPGVYVRALRAKAEHALAELLRDPGRFGSLARELSNCPSGAQGGELGPIGRGDTVPELERVLFNAAWLGIYPQLVTTRHGFHVVCVDRREPGRRLPFELVQDRIAARLSSRASSAALVQYVAKLAASAEISGCRL